MRAANSDATPVHLRSRGRLLLTAPANLRTEIFELVLPPEAKFQGEPHDPGSREFVHCVEGSVRCGPDGDPLDLGPGDTAYFDGNVPHTYAGGPEGGRAMLVMSYPINAQGTGP